MRFRERSRKPPLVEIGTGGCVFRQCTLMLESGSTLVAEAAESLELIDCKVSNIQGIAIDWLPGAGDVDLIISDTKLVARTALQLDHAFSGSCELVECRIVAEKAVHWLQVDDIGRPFAAGEFLIEACTIIATDAMLDCDWEDVPNPAQAAPLQQVQLFKNRLATPVIVRMLTQAGSRSWTSPAELAELSLTHRETSVMPVSEVEQSVGRSVDEAITDINREPELSDQMLESVVSDR